VAGWLNRTDRENLFETIIRKFFLTRFHIIHFLFPCHCFSFFFFQGFTSFIGRPAAGNNITQQQQGKDEGNEKS